MYLTNRFHVAVHLSFNRSQMTSKCGKNKKVAHEAIAECVTDVQGTAETLFAIYRLHTNQPFKYSSSSDGPVSPYI